MFVLQTKLTANAILQPNSKHKTSLRSEPVLWVLSVTFFSQELTIGSLILSNGTPVRN